MILSLFDKENSSIGSIATSAIAKEVEKMEGNDIFKYNLKHSQKFKGLKLYKRKHLLSVAVCPIILKVSFWQMIIIA